MAVTNYETVNGQIVAEYTSGVATEYIHDALGSVIATTDASRNVQNTYRWAGYGTQIAKTGTAADPEFLWNGTSGYRATGRTHASHYVRRRVYSKLEANWTTADPLWPTEQAYGYALGNSCSLADPAGLNCAGGYFGLPDCVSYEICHQLITVNDGSGKTVYTKSTKTFLNPTGCVQCPHRGCSRVCGATQTESNEVTVSFGESSSTDRYNVNLVRTCDDSHTCHPSVNAWPLVMAILGAIPLGSSVGNLVAFISQYMPGCNSTKTFWSNSAPKIHVNGHQLQTYQVYAWAAVDVECCECLVAGSTTPNPCKPPPIPY